MSPDGPAREHRASVQVRFVARMLAVATQVLTIYALAAWIHGNLGAVQEALLAGTRRVAGVYRGVRNGAYRIDCAVGAAPIQMAECQIVQACNLVLIQTVTQLAEFVYSIAHMKNVFGCLTLLCGIMYPIRRALSPHSLALPLRALVRYQCAYFKILYEQYFSLCCTLHRYARPAPRHPRAHFSMIEDTIHDTADAMDAEGDTEGCRVTKRAAHRRHLVAHAKNGGTALLARSCPGKFSGAPRTAANE